VLNLKKCQFINSEENPCQNRHMLWVSDDCRLLRKICRSHYIKKAGEKREAELKEKFSRSPKQRSIKRYAHMQLELGINVEYSTGDSMDCMCCRFSGNFSSIFEMNGSTSAISYL